MDSLLDLTKINSLCGCNAKLFVVDFDKQEQILLAEFDHVLINIDLISQPVINYELNHGYVNLINLRSYLKKEDILNKLKYQFVIEFIAEAEVTQNSGYKGTLETTTYKHGLKLENCILENISPEILFSYATASITRWNGTAENLLPVVRKKYGALVKA